jgi:hypothetical protein
MMDRSHAGVRCRARCHLQTVEGLLRRDSHGTIRYTVAFMTWGVATTDESREPCLMNSRT